MGEQHNKDSSELENEAKQEAEQVSEGEANTSDDDAVAEAADSNTSPEESSEQAGEQASNQQDLLRELELAQQEAAKMKDAFLRAKAEQDNIRRRSEKEVANGRKFAVEGFAKEMLNVRDSLKLACTVEVGDDADESVKNIHEGVTITLKQLDSAFAKFALSEIAPEVGEKLDPNLHQAMSMIESEEVESGCIINVIQAGFKLHERLLRPAMVVVAK
jgi:molecular chaperone GrpE